MYVYMYVKKHLNDVLLAGRPPTARQYLYFCTLKASTFDP